MIDPQGPFVAANSSAARVHRLGVFLACGLCLVIGLYLGATGRSNSAFAMQHSPEKAKAAMSGVKAPIEEILHCPLAFAGIHLMKDVPERSAIAYHFCKPLNE